MPKTISTHTVSEQYAQILVLSLVSFCGDGCAQALFAPSDLDLIIVFVGLQTWQALTVTKQRSCLVTSLVKAPFENELPRRVKTPKPSRPYSAYSKDHTDQHGACMCVVTIAVPGDRYLDCERPVALRCQSAAGRAIPRCAVGLGFLGMASSSWLSSHDDTEPQSLAENSQQDAKRRKLEKPLVCDLCGRTPED